jgi:transposase
VKESWSGIDVSKAWFDASWVAVDKAIDDFAKIPHARFDRTPEGVQQYLSWLQQQGSGPVRVLMEATGRYSIELSAWLVAQQPQLAPAIVNPKTAKHYHQSLGLRNRTDRVDARSLGLMGQERKPPPYEALPEAYQKIRALMRQRRCLVNTRTAEKQRLSEIEAGSSALRRILKSHLRHLEKLLQRIDRALEQVLSRCDQLRQDLAYLETIPGVGRITALTILGELGDLRRFNRSRQVSALSGLSPSNQQSGSSKNYSHIDRNANPEVRSVLYLASMAACCKAKDNHLARTYQHLLEEGKEHKQALVAVARKILVIGRSLLINEQPYVDNYQPAKG